MKLNINYYYNQKFLPTKRHKKVRERQIKDVISVNISELTEDVFPIAFIVHDMKSIQEGMTSFENESYVIHNLERIVCKKRYIDNDIEFSENSVIVEENKKEVRRMLRNSAKHYIYFDRKFWSVCGEPRYNIITFGLGHNHGGTGFFIEYEYNPNISSKNYFSALQRNEAIAYGKSVALNRGDTESVDGIGKYDNIEVVMPEMVKVNPTRGLRSLLPCYNK